MSFPNYPQKENVFSLYSSFNNPLMDVNVHTQSELPFVSTPWPVKSAVERDALPMDDGVETCDTSE